MAKLYTMWVAPFRHHAAYRGLPTWREQDSLQARPPSQNWMQAQDYTGAALARGLAETQRTSHRNHSVLEPIHHVLPNRLANLARTVILYGAPAVERM